VVALSGIDGSGKSSQARALAGALDALGHPAAVVWAPTADAAWLDRLARPVKRLLALVPPLQPPARPPETPIVGRVPNPGRTLRERSSVLTAVWSALVAVGFATSVARTAFAAARAGHVVVFDRYQLDSAVRLRWFYGEGRPYRAQEAIIRTLVPRPVCAFWLDVPVEVSLRRKADDGWSPEELALQRRLYGLHHGRFGAVRLDGRGPGRPLRRGRGARLAPPELSRAHGRQRHAGRRATAGSFTRSYPSRQGVGGRGRDVALAGVRRVPVVVEIDVELHEALCRVL
jgi:thymidylate kinase